MRQRSEGCVQLRRGRGNEGNGAQPSLERREDVEVGAKRTESWTSVVRSPYRDRDMKLRQYELSEGDWDIARQLRDVLKVCSYAQLFLSLLTITLLDLQGRHPLFFTTDPQHRHCHTSYRPHQRTSFYGCHQSQIPSRNQGWAHNWQKNT